MSPAPLPSCPSLPWSCPAALREGPARQLSLGDGPGRVLFSSLGRRGREKSPRFSPEALCAHRQELQDCGWPGGPVWGSCHPALLALPSRVSESCREAGHRLHCDSVWAPEANKRLCFRTLRTLTSRQLLCRGQRPEGRPLPVGKGPSPAFLCSPLRWATWEERLGPNFSLFPRPRGW